MISVILQIFHTNKICRWLILLTPLASLLPLLSSIFLPLISFLHPLPTYFFLSSFSLLFLSFILFPLTAFLPYPCYFFPPASSHLLLSSSLTPVISFLLPLPTDFVPPSSFRLLLSFSPFLLTVLLSYSVASPLLFLLYILIHLTSFQSWACVPAGPSRDACPRSFISSLRSAFPCAFSKLFFCVPRFVFQIL